MLLSGWGSVPVYLAAGATDLRKSFDGLAQLVRERMQEDPWSGALYVFCNRHRNRIRILYFDGTGPWVFSKRLEQGTFHWPAQGDDSKTWRVSREQLLLILSGLDLERVRPRAWYGRGKRRRRRRSA